MPTLRLLPGGPAPEHLGGGVGACAFTPDNAFVLSGGFDGRLQLWEASQCALVTDFQVSQKPVSACAVSPDGRMLTSGALDGMVGLWDAVSHEPKMTFMGSPRPISCLAYSDDGNYLANAAWDGNLTVWHSLKDRHNWVLTGHRDIAAGCCFTPDARQLLSWSYDSTVRLWDMPYSQSSQELLGHEDRVTAGAISPDGRLAATGGRDGSLLLWDLQAGSQASSGSLLGEIRGCKFLGDGSLLLAVDQTGRITLHQVPSLQERRELATGLTVECCQLSPNHRLLALGLNDGRIRMVSIEGIGGLPLLAGVTQITHQTATTLQRWFGKSTVTYRYECTCPNCQQVFQLPSGAPGTAANCPQCRQSVKSTGVVRAIKE